MYESILAISYLIIIKYNDNKVKNSQWTNIFHFINNIPSSEYFSCSQSSDYYKIWVFLILLQFHVTRYKEFLQIVPLNDKKKTAKLKACCSITEGPVQHIVIHMFKDSECGL